MIFRHNLCSLPALVIAYAEKFNCEIGEAADELVTKFNEIKNVAIYDGRGDGSVKLISEKLKSEGCYKRLNNKWWLLKSDFTQADFSPFDMLIEKKEAEKAFDLKEVFEIDRSLYEFGLPINNFRKFKGVTKQTEIIKTEQSVSFDKSCASYPIELDLALQAWRAVTSSKAKGKPKARIKKWLDDNTNLSNEAKERISIVANWDKSGGATRSD